MWKFISLFLLLSCANVEVEKGNNTKEEPVTYYSDYFVFLADDGGSPLVVPVDFNWLPTEAGYEIEYKCWYGTQEEWPIHYLKKEIKANASAIPNEAFQHADTKVFDFNLDDQVVSVRMDGAPQMEIRIPDKQEWVLPEMESDFPTYGFKTSILLDGKKRSGWMLYERIRATAALKFDGFAAFYWMPVVIDGKLYHFTQHKGKQTAVRWQQTEDGIQADVLPAYQFDVLESQPDSKSGRSAVAKTVQLQAPAWDVNISLTSTGNQTGHGDQHPNGLALYRQSLLESSEASVNQGVGMMELILADD